MSQISKAGFSSTLREDGIIHYHFEDFTRSTIDAWVETGSAHDQEALASGKHLLRLNTSAPNLLPSPYALSRAKYMSETSPQILVSEAFVTNNTIANPLATAFINQITNRQLKASIKVFKTESEAITWLLQSTQEKNPD